MDAIAINPLTPFLQEQGVVILDGALATELENRGADLRDALWTAKVLVEEPELIRDTHYDYFVAGADVATTASYQATFAGFAKRGIGHDEATRLMHLSVSLAVEAREQFWNESANRRGRQKPLVAASVGPYGAYLANGAEYTGNYGLTLQELIDFHAPRLEVLATSGADLLACETLPSLLEVEALIALLGEMKDQRAWLSCCCGDGQRLWHGEALSEVVDLANACEQVIAVGVNCTAPTWMESLITVAREHTQKPIVAYPNRGEGWDAANKCWVPNSGAAAFSDGAIRWYGAGARLIGGCCRTTPVDIATIANSLKRPVTQ